MQKTVTYLFPNMDKASSLKVFQDRTTQITGLYFTRDNIRDVEAIPNSTNYAIYFLFNNSEEDENRIYIGQSINGVGRIKDHVANKDFWSFCIMFVTDNNSFDKLTIDYLEYEFINRFKKSSYILTNKDERNNCPNFSIYDKPTFDSFVNQIEFLLNTEGVDLSSNSILNDNVVYYEAIGAYDAKIYVSNGKFVVCKGSELNRPIESSRKYSGNFYDRYNSQIDAYLSDGKIKQAGEKFISLVDLAFDSPSRAAEIISGRSKNGWDFFRGLNELRSL